MDPFRIEAATASDLEEVLSFLAREQQVRVRSIAYLGDSRDGIRSELEQLEPTWWDTLRIVRDLAGSICAVAFADRDEELGRAWIHGPWTTEDAWPAVARPLLDAVRAELPVTASFQELCGPVENVRLAELAAELGWTPTEVNHVLVLGRAVPGAAGSAVRNSTSASVPIEGPRAGDPVAARRDDAATGSLVAPPEPDDLEQVARLHDAEFPLTYYSARQLLDQNASGEATVLVAPRPTRAPLTPLRRRVLDGYVAGRVTPDGDGYIDFLAVDPEARRRGVGRSLVTALTARFFANESVARVCLTVRDSLAPARGLYRSLGFRAESSIVGYRSAPPEPASPDRPRVEAAPGRSEPPSRAPDPVPADPDFGDPTLSAAADTAACPDLDEAALNSAALAPDLDEAALNSAALAPDLDEAAPNSAALAPDLDEAALNSAAAAAADPDFDDWESFDVEGPELSAIIVELKRLQGIARRHERAGEAIAPDPPGDSLGRAGGRDRPEGTRAEGTERTFSSPPTAPRKSPTEGLTHWGPLVVRERLGAGTSGDIFRAFDPQLQREVALKLQPAGRGRSERALAEARRLARVRHANVLSIHGADVFDGLAGIWTDLLGGETLEEKLHREGKQSEVEASMIGIDLCRALQAVHRAGLVHGDVKAANVMCEEDGSIVLLDFGSGRVLAGVDPVRPGESQNLPGAPGPGDVPLGGTDLVISGTPLAMAPEIFFGVTPSGVTDVYALGVLLYRLTTGVYPVRAGSVEDLIAIHRIGNEVRLRDADEGISAEFAEIVDRALASEPERRFTSARQMEDALARLAQRRIEDWATLRRATCPNNVPRAVSSFVGREAEVAELRSLLQEKRLVTLTGVGGSGKTRLATETAASLLRGVFDEVRFVGLAALSDPERILPAIGEVLGLRDSGTGSWSSAIEKRVDASALLLVLDNCEHLLEGAGAVALDLLARCPGLRILSTSQEALGLFGEKVYGVPPLRLPSPSSGSPADEGSATLTGEAASAFRSVESVALFLDRAESAGAEIALGAEEADAIARICRHLDGIPLALELAAVRARSLPLPEIVARLDRRFQLLTSRSAVPSRHQTLAATIDWSHGLLSPPEQRLFRRLAIFVGGWTLEAAEHICAAPRLTGGGCEADDVLDLLTRLVDRNLVGLDAQGSRYSMLETIHAYAREKLAESLEEESLAARHRDYFVKLAANAKGRLRRPDEAIWIRRVRADLENLRSALESCYWSEVDPELAVSFAASFAAVGSAIGNWKESVEVGDRMLLRDRARAASPGTRCDLLVATGVLHTQMARWDSSARLLGEAHEIALALPDRARLGAVLGSLGNLAYSRGEFGAAMHHHRESLACATTEGDPVRVAICLSNIGNILEAQGDYEGAGAHLSKSLEASRIAGDQRSTGYVLGRLGDVALATNRLGDAERSFEESLEVRREIADLWGVAVSLAGLGDVLWRKGEFVRAAELLDEGVEILREIGDRNTLVKILTKRALLLFERRDYLAVSRCLREVVEVGWRIGEARDVAIAFLIAGSVFLETGRVEVAARVFGAVDMLGDEFESIMPAPNVEHARKEKARIIALLGEEAEALFARGRAMSVEEAVALVLEATSTR